MTRKETMMIMGVLRTAYPAYYKDAKNAEVERAVDLWHSMFEDQPVQAVAAAVKAYIAWDAKGFPPHIGAIKGALQKISTPTGPSEQEAIGLVLRAAANSTYGAEEEFEKLPPILQKIVGSPAQLRSWAGMEVDAVQSVVASNLQRSYRALQKDEQERMLLPADVRHVVERLQAGMTVGQIGDGKGEGCAPLVHEE